MTDIPPCAFCGKEQDEKGGLVFSPPKTDIIYIGRGSDVVEKHHICKLCYNDLILRAILKQN